MALGMLLAMVVPVVATGAQTWNLDSTDDQATDPGEYPLPDTAFVQMEKVAPPAFDPQHTQSGSVTLTAGGSQVWIADQVALADVTFEGGDGAWILELVMDDQWPTYYDNDLASDAISTENLGVEIGYVDDADNLFHAFTSITSDPATVEIVNGTDMYIVTITPSWQENNETVYTGDWLAIRVTNWDDQDHTVFSGEDEYSSCLTSTGTDPGYPLPELAAGILLGAGILGVGGFWVLRRKHTSSART